MPVFLSDPVPPILAVGGELKNTICLTKDKHAFLSQHLGDLENLEGYRFFEEAIDHLSRVLEIRPEVVAYDLHPDYFSTKWALRKTGVKLVGVQHHHAHIASCMRIVRRAGKFRAAEPLSARIVYPEGPAKISGAGYLVIQRILIRFLTASNSESLVNTVASRRWAVAMQKASA